MNRSKSDKFLLQCPYLSVLFEQNPQSVGGALPDDAFYFSR